MVDVSSNDEMVDTGQFLVSWALVSHTYNGWLKVLLLCLNLDRTTRRGYSNLRIVLLRGAILIRTHVVFKNPYITLFLHMIFGPDYYGPP